MLNLNHFQPEDSGRYTITANNGVGKAATHEFELDVELAEQAPEFTQVPRDVTLTTGDDHVIVAEITGVPKPNVYVTDEAGGLVPGESQIEEVDGETIRYSLSIPNIQVGVSAIICRSRDNAQCQHHIFHQIEEY